MPKSIKSIDDNFRDCINLVSIEVEEGNPVFHSVNNCIIETESKTLITNCKTSVIPSDGSVTNIYRYAFQGCSNITSLSIPFVGATMNGTTNSYFGYIFGADLYHNHNLIPNNLKEVIITGGTTIGENAFYGYDSITDIIIHNGVVNIEDRAFMNCDNLTNLTLPSSIANIGNDILNGSGNIKIIFQGTKAQWNAINKKNNWAEGAGNIIIYCSNGALNKNGTDIYF